MADHDVLFTVPQRELKRAPIRFVVRKDKQAFGTLEISECGLNWWPLKKQRSIGIGWSEFDKFAREKQ